MRPGRIRPGKILEGIKDGRKFDRFNEAGADPPRKVPAGASGVVAAWPASMRPGRIRPGKLIAAAKESFVPDRRLQ